MFKDRKAPSGKNHEAELFGLDEEESLVSVNFATNENSLLNEHFQETEQK